MRIFFLCSVVVIMAGGLASVSGEASAASFNCNHAKGCVENIICESPQLSDLDSEMASLYYTLKRKSNRRGARTLLKSQRRWLRTRNTCHCDANCLVGHYHDRIELFKDVLDY
jgi:uncharacterized protein